MSSSDQLLQLINDANLPPKLLTTKNVSFGTVAIEDDPDYNTSLLVSGVPINGYSGEVTINYKRLALSDIVTTTLRTTTTIDKAACVALVNQAYGMFLIEDDLEDFTPPTLDSSNPSATISLTANVNSIGFTGTVDLIVQYGNAYLDGVIYVRALPTLVHPITVPDRQSARMVTWNKDFTSVASAIKPDSTTSTYSDWDTVQTVASSFGIPAWPIGPVTDNEVSAISDANPAFDRVVIQKSIYTNDLEGDLYFHYNVI
jgi:hypothetical protein